MRDKKHTRCKTQYLLKRRVVQFLIGFAYLWCLGYR